LKPGRYIWIDPASGLEAVLYVDSLVLGPAVGGVRTKSYPTLNDAIADAAALARAMTVKAALAGLDAGGCKIVVRGSANMHREQAFERLGMFLAELGDHLHTGADFGTSEADMRLVARRFSNVHLAGPELLRAAGRGVLRCIEACARVRGRDRNGLRVAVQGIGSMGAAVARALADAGVELVLVDVERARAEDLAAELGAEVGSADEFLELDVDVLAPCAVGGVIDASAAGQIRAWAVCGAANNIVTDRIAERELVGRGLLVVPDSISSAGAVTQGFGHDVMGIADTDAMVDRLGEVAEEVLQRAEREGRTPDQVAIAMAEERILGAA
jgi:leucine dehydrogenase